MILTHGIYTGFIFYFHAPHNLFLQMFSNNEKNANNKYSLVEFLRNQAQCCIFASVKKSFPLLASRFSYFWRCWNAVFKKTQYKKLCCLGFDNFMHTQ